MPYPNHMGQALRNELDKMVEAMSEQEETNIAKFDAIDEFLNSLSTLIDDLRSQL